MEALRRQKALDGFLNNLYEKRLKIESLLLALIESDTNLSTFSALKAAVDNHKENPPISLAEVEQLRDDIENQRELSEEFNELIGNRDPQVDEELERELEALEAVEDQEDIIEIPREVVAVRGKKNEEKKLQVII